MNTLVLLAMIGLEQDARRVSLLFCRLRSLMRASYVCTTVAILQVSRQSMSHLLLGLFFGIIIITSMLFRHRGEAGLLNR